MAWRPLYGGTLWAMLVSYDVLHFIQNCDQCEHLYWFLLLCRPQHRASPEYVPVSNLVRTNWILWSFCVRPFKKWLTSGIWRAEKIQRQNNRLPTGSYEVNEIYSFLSRWHFLTFFILWLGQITPAQDTIHTGIHHLHTIYALYSNVAALSQPNEFSMLLSLSLSLSPSACIIAHTLSFTYRRNKKKEKWIETMDIKCNCTIDLV